MITLSGEMGKSAFYFDVSGIFHFQVCLIKANWENTQRGLGKKRLVKEEQTRRKIVDKRRRICPEGRSGAIEPNRRVSCAAEVDKINNVKATQD